MTDRGHPLLFDPCSLCDFGQALPAERGAAAGAYAGVCERAGHSRPAFALGAQFGDSLQDGLLLLVFDELPVLAGFKAIVGIAGGFSLRFEILQNGAGALSDNQSILLRY